LLIDVLAAQQVPYMAIEHDAHVVATLRSRGVPVVYGNAARVELLGKLKATGAAAIVITMDQPAAVIHAVRSIRQAYPDIPVLVRSRDEKHARELLMAGATVVVPEALEAALHLASVALHQVGLSELAISVAINAERDERLSRYGTEPTP
jgi:monovalent cation:H+ antiporter-2, CPA2 family